MRFKELFESEISPEAFHKELLKVAPFMKLMRVKHFGEFDGWEFGSAPAGPDGYYSDPTISGIYLAVPHDLSEPIDITEIGIQSDLQGQGYGARIIQLLLRYFPNSKFHVSDGSDGFWAKIEKKFPGRFEISRGLNDLILT